MGYEDVVMGEWEQGWHSSDKLICPNCVGDDYLKAIVASAAADGQECSFCNATPAAEFDAFMEAFMVGINNLFEQADNAGMPWDGGYVFTTYNWYELPDEFGWVTAGEHADKVLEELGDRLAEKTYASRWWTTIEPDEAFSIAWKDFKEQIMHRTRFVFWATKVDADQYKGSGEVSVAGILQDIGALLVRFELITPLPTGTLTYRARGHTQADDSQGWRATDLGTNLPENSTNSTRMSPAGIPLFYGADDTDTTLAEVAAADPREFFTVGQFATTAPITVIDLTNVPAVPSIFDPELGRWHRELIFLNELVEELRQPVDPARSNLDYVPTQAFCEYFLRAFKVEDPVINGLARKPAAIADRSQDDVIHGLAWKSAVAADGGRCLALDILQKDCVDTADNTANRPQLELVPGSKTIHQRRTDEFRQL
jgi:hypothetical protein